MTAPRNWKPGIKNKPGGQSFMGVPRSPLNNPDIVLPPNRSRAVRIQAPSDDQLSVPAVESFVNFPPLSSSTLRALSSSTPQPPRAPESDEDDMRNGVLLSAAPTMRKYVQTIASSSALINGDPMPLDIYANNYIPLWLKAVNQCPVVIRDCLPLEHFDFAHYINSFAGIDFLRCLPPVQKPQASYVDLSSEPALQSERYGKRLRAQLQNEITAQAAELQEYYLFNVRLGSHNSKQKLFSLTVPGLREGTPRVDLGDIILVRPIVQPSDESSAAVIANAWYGCGSTKLFPFSFGTEFRAVVWGISRPLEHVVLRIDGYPTRFDCNVIFTVQDDRVAAQTRGVDFLATSLEHSLRLTPGSSIHPVISTPSSASYRSWTRSMLFPNNSDAIMQTTLPQGRFDIEWIDESLNYEQQKAVNAVVKQNYGTVPYLISGPPGTGKTKTIVETTLQLLRSQPSPHLLLCAPSDPAADTLALRLSRHLGPKEMFRLNSWTRTFAEVPSKLLRYSFTENNLFSIPDFRSMMSFTVVVTTCRDASLLVQARLTNADLCHLMSQMRWVAGTMPENVIHWSGLLLDEAAQATEPEAAIALSVLAPPHDCTPPPLFVLAGDEYQLGPRLAHKSMRSGLQLSLFQRLFELDFYARHPLSRSQGSKPLRAAMLPMPRPAFSNLFRNYRSHPAILAVPSMLFYHDTLIPEKHDNSDAIHNWSGWGSAWPVLFRQSSSPDDVESVLVGNGTGAGGVLNNGEATIALEYVQSLLRKRDGNRGEPLHPREIMVMSPFRAQVKTLRLRFREAGLYDVNIGPLEAFQGLESRVVVFCTTRTRLGSGNERDRFVRQDQALGLGVIDEPKRFNVAITRAMEGLIVIGNHECLTCTEDNAWMTFIAFCQRNSCMEGQAPEQLHGQFHPSRLERALRYVEELKSSHSNDRRRDNLPRRREPPHGIRLRGRMLSGDEAMLADHGVDYDHLLSIGSGNDDDRPAEDVVHGSDDRLWGQNMPGEDAMAAFDLDFPGEVERSDCLSQ